MNNRAKILFAVEDNDLKQFVEQTTGTFATLWMENTLHIYVKEVSRGRQQLDRVRMIAGSISKELVKRKVSEAEVNSTDVKAAFSALDGDKTISAFTEGWYLGAYAFDTYTAKKAGSAPKLIVTNGVVSKFVEVGRKRAEAMSFSRDLMNEIPSVLTPETFPKLLQEQFANTDVNVTVHDKKQLEEMEMNGILAVNRGSKFDPAMIELHYEGDATKPLVALVGKGVTFDTGGISLKRGRDISDMRMDMGGAAAVAGAIKLLEAIGANVNVVGIIQTVENIPDQKSILPGDVITYKTGQTVQIGNTDAEGRLILADGLIRADELNAEYVVDIATLTGAIVNALGPKMGGIFGEEELTVTMKKIGEENGDFVWPMPLIDDYDKSLKSDYADFSNISTQSSAGAITAALFLRRFVPDHMKWIHVDMAGVMDSKEKGYYSNGATGFGARLLADYAVHVSE